MVKLQVWDQVEAQLAYKITSPIATRRKTLAEMVVNMEIVTNVWEQIYNQVGADVQHHLQDQLKEQVIPYIDTV